jgi:hypothetical protein
MAAGEWSLRLTSAFLVAGRLAALAHQSSRGLWLPACLLPRDALPSSLLFAQSIFIPHPLPISLRPWILCFYVL